MAESLTALGVAVAELLKQRKQPLAVAESSAGGLINAALGGVRWSCSSPVCRNRGQAPIRVRSLAAIGIVGWCFEEPRHLARALSRVFLHRLGHELVAREVVARDRIELLARRVLIVHKAGE